MLPKTSYSDAAGEVTLYRYLIAKDIGEIKLNKFGSYGDDWTVNPNMGEAYGAFMSDEGDVFRITIKTPTNNAQWNDTFLGEPMCQLKVPSRYRLVGISLVLEEKEREYEYDSD